MADVPAGIYLPLAGIPVPPMLERALGYDGDAPLVAFWWTPGGDELCYADGRVELCGGNWGAWLDYVNHPRVVPYLAHYDFGSSELEGEHRLLLDRHSRTLAVADRNTATRLLARRTPPVRERDRGEEPVCENFEALMAELNRGSVHEDMIPDDHERMVRYDQAQAALRRWLDALEYRK
jgi:hypothetical protein